MVCSVDHLASNAGLATLRAGGSAADAAIATNAVLAVTSQQMCGMGGDLFALVHTGIGEPVALNASGRAGSGADAARLRAEGMTRMPPQGDIRSVPVPGCVDGWMALHERYGRLPLAEVLEPALSYAADGFPASPSLAAAASRLGDLSGAEDYTSTPIEAGSIMRRPGVARALEAIGRGGRGAWYEGEFGEELLHLGDGEYTDEDLRRVQADWVEPLRARAFGHDLWTIPPNSQGYLILAAAWIADGLDVPLDTDDAQWAHLLIEAARQAAFDRLAVLHEHADGGALLDAARLAPRRDAIDPTRAATLGLPTAAGGTTALCAADGDGMGVSLIQSNASGFGAFLATPRTRVFLQNRGIGFSLEPGHPAEYGPGRRPPHTLAPSLVTRVDGTLAALAATEGGDMQPHVLLQLLHRVLAAGQSPAPALAAGRWSLRSGDGGFESWDQHGRVVVHVEGQAPAAWDDELRARGHEVVRDAPWGAFGLSHVITAANGLYSGASDPRYSESLAAAY
jgi:gamma-glutamyltranspeptidase/glutathione hydrolase